MGINFKFLDDPTFRFLKQYLYDSEFHLSFLHDKFTDVNAWKTEARQYISDRLLFDPPEVPLNEKVIEEVDFPGYRRLKITFDSAPNYSIPAYLLIPKYLNEPAPAVVVMHDHSGLLYWGKEKVVEHHDGHEVLQQLIDGSYGGQPPASELAKRGYVTLVTDALFFGERKLNLDATPEFKKRLDQHPFESPAYISEYNHIESGIVESDVSKAFYYAGLTPAGVRMRDDMASVSYLCSRPEVDPERIGTAGLSMGGHRSAWLMAMDDRVKCGVVVGWMGLHAEMAEHRISNIHWMWNVPDLHHAMDYPDVISLSIPKPLMVMHGLQDGLFPFETGQKSMDKIAKVYEKAGASDQYAPRLIDTFHEYNVEMQAEANAWLDQHLRS